MMPQRLLFLCSLLCASTSAIVPHYSLPSSSNVFSPPVCKTNQDGFGGELGTDITPVTYNYEVELIGAEVNNQGDIRGALLMIERSIADFLLTTEPFDEVDCEDRRRARDADPNPEVPTLRKLDTVRRLTPVGLTINPTDDVLEGCK